MKPITDYVGHDFYTTDELNDLMADMGGMSKFKTIKNFLYFIRLKQCAICKVYTSNYVKSTHLEQPPNESALVCNYCEDFRSNYNHHVAMQLAKIWINNQLVLTDVQGVIRKEAETIIRESKDLNIDSFTDELKIEYHRKAKQMDILNHDGFTELEREYDKFICHLWKLVKVQDETYFLFCGDGFTQTTIDKVFNDTREIVSYNREEFLNVFMLKQDDTSKLYRRHLLGAINE